MESHTGGTTPTLRYSNNSNNNMEHDAHHILSNQGSNNNTTFDSDGIDSNTISNSTNSDLHITASSTLTPSLSTGSVSPSPSVKESMISLETEHFRNYVKHDKYMILHKIIYFIGMGANASIYPFIVIRWRTLGLTDLQAGSIMAIAHIGNLALSPLIGSFADRSENHRKGVLLGGFLAASIFGYLLAYAFDYWTSLFLYLAMDTCVTNVWPIMDSSVYAILESTSGHTEGYGANRAFGAAGWGIWAWISGSIFDTYGLDKMFLTFLLGLLPVLPLVYRLPVEKRKATKKSASNAWKRIATVDVFIFVIVVYITAILLCICDIYRSPYLAEMGASNELLGFSITATSISEFPFFFVATWVLKRVSIPIVLLSVLLAYAVRFWYYSIITNPWLTIPAELLHGVQFALGWAASTNYVAQLLPPELSSTAQALLASVQWGLGSSTGALLGGALMDEYGGRNMFRSGAVLALIGSAIMGMSIYRKYRINQLQYIKHAVQLEEEQDDKIINEVNNDVENNRNHKISKDDE